MLKVRDLASRSDFTEGTLTISPSRRIIAGSAGQASLEPRIMQVLLLLLDASGTVVTRDQIFDECWGGVIVGDDSINRAIGRLRRVLTEVAPGAVDIETIPRTGYRLILRGAEAQVGAAEPITADERNARWSWSRRRLLGGGLALAAAGGAAIWQPGKSKEDPAAQLIAESDAVARAGKQESTAQALALLRRAVAVSPNNAQAWGALALAVARSEHPSLAHTTSPTLDVERAAQRALRLDPANADAKAALAIAVPYYGDWLAAERRFDAVLAQHPRHLATIDAKAFLMAATGRPRESSEMRLRLLSGEPFDVRLHYRQIYAYWMLDRIAEADQVSSRAMEMFPRHPGVWFGRLWLLASTGRVERALALVDDAYGRPPLAAPTVASLRSGLTAALTRDRSDVDAAVRQMMAGVHRSVNGVVNAIMLFNIMGATDPAFDLADAYYLERGPILAAMQWRPGQPRVPDVRGRKTNMLFTPNAAIMRRDPRFLPLMQEMGLVNYWRQRNITPDFLRR